MAEAFTIENAVICDDARREITNKDILIGVYANVIAASALPASLNLCCWMEVSAKSRGPMTIQIKVETPDSPMAAQMNVDVQVDDPAHNFGVFTPQLMYPITRSGDIKFHVRAAGSDKWRLAKKVKVVHSPAASFSMPPPS